MVKSLKVLVTGANGQLGSCLRDLAPTSQHKFVFTDVDTLDITNVDSVRKMFAAEMPDFVVNCAAYTAVDKAESDIKMAKLLNASAVEILSQESEKIGAGIVHISTDYVFKGDQPEPRVEDDQTDPQSVYGSTKLDGEVFALKNPRSIVIRTSWLYSVYGNNFVKTMQRLGAERASINVVADQWGSPTSAEDLAKAVLTVLDNPHYGLFHFSNEGITNWAIFAEEIMRMSGLKCVVNHISSGEYPTAANRPMYSIMSKKKFSQVYDVKIPDWEQSLEEIINKLN